MSTTMSNTTASLALWLTCGTMLVGTIIPLSLRIRHDYQAFLSLGPGGTPATISGYLKIKMLGLFALQDPYSAPPIPRGLTSPTGYLLGGLPTRPYSRPLTKGIAPQRQLTQCARPAVYARLTAAIDHMAAAAPRRFEIRTSCFEKHSIGLFARVPQRQTCKGEICHAHPSDGSLHLTLHPADAKVVLESGWGQRHPISRGGFFERFVPRGFLMVYAPQTDDEVSVIMQIIAAAAWHVCGEDESEVEEIRDAACSIMESEACRERGLPGMGHIDNNKCGTRTTPLCDSPGLRNRGELGNLTAAVALPCAS